jgi:cytochrome P450
MSHDCIEIPTSTINLQDRSFVADPYPALRAVQDAGPVVYHEGLGEYFVARWQECTTILSSPARYVEDEQMANRFFGGESMKGLDDPRHDLLRGIWADAFRRGSIETKRDMIAEIVDEQLLPFVQRLKAGGPLDAVSGMVRAIPTIVIAKLLGIPGADHRQFTEWSELMIGVAAGAVNDTPEGRRSVQRGMQATAEMNSYLRGQYLERGDESADDLIGRLISSPVSRDMSERDAVASFTQLGFAGNETTPKLMATVLYALARFPDQRELLLDDRSLIPQAIEEINRWSSPAQVNWRIVQPGGGGGAISGAHVPEGATLLCLEGMANRDPRRWDDPDRLDVLRARLPNMGFGFGRHTCLGIHLARLETQVWLERVLDEIPEWTVADLDWGTSWVARGPVRIDIAA